MRFYYQINKLPSYLPTELPDVKKFQQKKSCKVLKLRFHTKLTSYQATYLLSYRYQIFSGGKKSYRATYLLSYRQHVWSGVTNEATKLPTYLVTTMKFFPADKKKLPSYLPTELPGVKKFSTEEKLPSFQIEILLPN